MRQRGAKARRGNADDMAGARREAAPDVARPPPDLRYIAPVTACSKRKWGNE